MTYDAIAFDAFGTLFDLGEIETTFKSTVVPWTWHVTAAGHFRPLPEIVQAAGIDPERVKALPVYPDVEPALAALANTPLAVLSNGTADGIEALVTNAGLTNRFDHLLAAEQARRYKPAPEVYALATAAFATTPGRVLLVSSNEWDVAGAKQAGLKTAWVARGREPGWLLNIEPDRVVQQLTDL